MRGQGKRKRPGRCVGLRLRTFRGCSNGQGPPLVECRALAFVSTCSHRPSRLAAWRAMPRVGLDTGLPASNPWHRFTLTRLPEPSVLVPIGTDLAESSWGGPSSFGSSTTAPLPIPSPRAPRCTRRWNRVPHPKVRHRPSPEGLERARSLRRIPRRLRVAPWPDERSSRSPSPTPPEGDRRPGLTRRPPRSPVAFADPSSPPTSRRRPTARFGVAVNTVRVPIPLRLVSGVGRAGAPSSPLRSACALRNEHQ
jgi:hypothetical protein